MQDLEERLFNDEEIETKETTLYVGGRPAISQKICGEYIDSKIDTVGD